MLSRLDKNWEAVKNPYIEIMPRKIQMKIPERIAIIQSAKQPKWHSCKSISNNLAAAYKLAFGPRCRFFSIPMADQEEIWRVAQAVHQYSPERIVFISNEPHPIRFLNVLKQVQGLKRLPELYFHVYGDFTLGSSSWLQCWSILSETPCIFFGASKRQQNFMKRLFLNSENTGYFPFPVDGSIFKFDPKIREEWRKKLGVGINDKVLIYSGRISLQKNVDLLLQKAAKVMQEDPAIRLWITGSIDDMDSPLFGWPHPLGSYDTRISRELAGLNPSVRKRIWRMGAVSHDSLRSLYNAADGFMSFSLYHDEDYGMAAAEALLSGLPLCLTRWGGYSQFVQNQLDGVLVPVGIARNGLRIDKNNLFDAIRRIAAFSTEKKERRIRAKNGAERFGLEASARTLRELHQAFAPPLAGFTRLFSQLAFLFSGNTIAYPGGPGSTQIYEDVYSAYFQTEA